MMNEDDSFTAFRNALSEQDRDKRLQKVHNLIKTGANVNSITTSGHSVLLDSAALGYVECVRLLLESGANVHYVNIFGRTPLIEAATAGHVECVRLFLEAGADVNQFDGLCESVLIKTVRRGNIIGNTALMHCMNPYGDIDIKGQYVKTLKLLVEAGANIDAQNIKMQRPIHRALYIYRHFTFPAEYLISENCNLIFASHDLIQERADDLKETDRLDILKLLTACGLPRYLFYSFIVNKETSVRKWVETVTSQPKTLKSTCVFKIRRRLGLGIKSKVSKLNLPTVIQNLILLKGILSLECFI